MSQGAGRFDVPDLSQVWYFAESETHAIGEVLQGLRNQSLDDADLFRFGHRLALVAATLRPPSTGARLLVDLCDPVFLRRYRIRPDTLASVDFSKTQAVAGKLFAAGCAGFRWWSALGGDWHTTVIFNSRIKRASLVFRDPAPLTLGMPALQDAARRLGIRTPA